MSEDPKETEPSLALPAPKRFVLSPVEDGAYQKHLPTITAVYLGADRSPIGEDLMRLGAAALERDPSSLGRLYLSMFIAAPDEDTMEFAEQCSFEMSSDKMVVEKLWDNVVKVKQFILAVSCNDYYFRCKVNQDTAQITEMACDWRYLH